MKIKFKLLDILGETLKVGDYAIGIPSAVSTRHDGLTPASTSFPDDLVNFYGEVSRIKGGKVTKVHGDNSGCYTTDRDTLPLKQPLVTVSDLFKSEKYLSTFSVMSTEQNNAVSSILKVLKPTVDTQVFIAPFLIDSKIVLGFNGISICLYENRVGIWWGDVRSASHLSAIDELIKRITPFDLAKKESYDILISNFGASPRVLDAEKTIKNAIENAAINARARKREVLGVIPAYKEALVFLKEVNQVRDLPPTISKLVKKTGATMRGTVDTVKGYGSLYRKAIEDIQSAKENVDDLKICIEEAASDWKAVKKLLERGFIEKFEGSLDNISWTYPPQTYFPRLGDCPEEVFLGRVRVTLSGSSFIRVEPISYKYNYEFCGTWHFDNKGRLCLGSFQTTLNNLIAKRQIAQLIHVFKEFSQSSNPESPITRPKWECMKLAKPQVSDDSFKVWNEQKEKKSATKPVEPKAA